MESDDRPKWKLLLKSIKFFSGFADEHLDELLNFSEVRKFQLHSYIIKEGEKNFSFYVVLKGNVNIVKETGVKGKKTITSLPAGECFGEIAVLLNEPRSASVIAGGEVTVFRIHGNKIAELSVETREKLYKQLAINLAEHLKETSSQITGKKTRLPFEEI